MSIGANFNASIGTDDLYPYLTAKLQASPKIHIYKTCMAPHIKTQGYIAPNKDAARSKIGDFREAAAIKLFCAFLLQRNQTADKSSGNALRSATAKFNTADFKPTSKTAEMKF